MSKFVNVPTCTDTQMSWMWSRLCFSTLTQLSKRVSPLVLSLPVWTRLLPVWSTGEISVSSRLSLNSAAVKNKQNKLWKPQVNVFRLIRLPFNKTPQFTWVYVSILLQLHGKCPPAGLPAAFHCFYQIPYDWKAFTFKPLKNTSSEICPVRSKYTPPIGLHLQWIWWPSFMTKNFSYHSCSRIHYFAPCPWAWYVPHLL